MYELTKEQYDKLVEFAMKGQEEGSAYPGMSYEEGIMAVIDVIDGNITVEEAT